jgi:hypothetical protein
MWGTTRIVYHRIGAKHGKQERMKYTHFKKDAVIYQSNIRAEDGFQKRGSWNRFCEGVLIPLGSLFAVFLAMLGMMLIAD